MTKPPYAAGDFIWCRFPFSENPTSPGPQDHLTYIADTYAKPGKPTLALCLYTTSQPWPNDKRLPVGLLPISPKEAASLRQKPFIIDARRLAFLPITRDFFPYLDAAHRGLSGRAPPHLQTDILRQLTQLAKRPDLLEYLGPERPRTNESPQPPDRTR